MSYVLPQPEALIRLLYGETSASLRAGSTAMATVLRVAERHALAALPSGLTVFLPAGMAVSREQMEDRDFNLSRLLKPGIS